MESLDTYFIYTFSIKLDLAIPLVAKIQDARVLFQKDKIILRNALMALTPNNYLAQLLQVTIII
jgi:hypothetical protein